MKYMGSKNSHAKEILPIILKNRKKHQYYVETFVGGSNTIDKIKGFRIGADVDEDLMCLWINAVKGWMPPEKMSKQHYEILKYAPLSPLKGFCAFALSFGDKKWAGFFIV